MSEITSLAQRVGLAVGAFYVAIGVLGFFVTGFNVGFTAEAGDKLLGVAINPFHNLAHIGIGAILLIFALQKNIAAAEGAVMGVGLFYIVAFVIGVTAPDNLTILGIRGEDQLANFFHAVTGILLLAVGLISSGQTTAEMRRSGLA
jgi:uncharacterized membrane protein